MRSTFRHLRPGGLRSTLPIAIDFGAKYLKLLQLASGDPPSLVSAAAVEVPEEAMGDSNDRIEFQLGALEGLLKKGGFRGRKVSCSIPASLMLCKHMRFKKEPGLNTDQLVSATIAGQLGCSPDALLCRHVEVAEVVKGSGGAKSEVISFATRRHLINKIMQTLTSCKLEPVGLHPECFGILSAFEHMNLGEAQDDRATLILDLGAGTTKVLITHGTKLVFAKTIHIGGHTLDQAVARQMRADLGRAHGRRLMAKVLTREDMQLAVASSSMAPEPAQVVSDGDSTELMVREVSRDVIMSDRGTDSLAFDLTEQLEALTDEIAMCQRYHESIFPGQRVSRAVFVGGESRHMALSQHVARKLRLPTQVADPLTRVGRTGKEPLVGIDLSEPRPGWAVPFGLCLCPTE